MTKYAVLLIALLMQIPAFAQDFVQPLNPKEDALAKNVDYYNAREAYCYFANQQKDAPAFLWAPVQWSKEFGQNLWSATRQRYFSRNVAFDRMTHTIKDDAEVGEMNYNKSLLYQKFVEKVKYSQKGPCAKEMQDLSDAFHEYLAYEVSSVKNK